MAYDPQDEHEAMRQSQRDAFARAEQSWQDKRDRDARQGPFGC
jgi:hypothetical protein